MQLKMYLELKPAEFPKPFGSVTYRTYDGPRKDRLDWLEICKDGLVGDKDGEDTFNSSFYGKPDFIDSDLYFIFDGGEPVATICGIYEKDSGHGYVHIVSVRKSARGKGLGDYINKIIIAHLSLYPCKIVYLKTDEWRVPAIRSYLKSGFLPVDCDDDMEGRWVKWLTEQGDKNLPLLDEQGGVKKLLCTKD